MARATGATRARGGRRGMMWPAGGGRGGVKAGPRVRLGRGATGGGRTAEVSLTLQCSMHSDMTGLSPAWPLLLFGGNGVPNRLSTLVDE